MENGSGKKLWRPGPKWLLGIPIGGFVMVVVGLLLSAGYSSTMQYTNSNDFCFSCHVGMDTIVEEYQVSVHGGNASGVVASCSDCHVPQELFPKLKTKIVATKDIYHMLVGTYNLENFEEHRTELATHTRDVMKSRDSKECRNCHDVNAWQVDLQSAKAQQSHNLQAWADKGKTCVSCHIGVAHKKPR